MLLPPTFQFSQASFQDYVDCARRFQLRYVLMQPWPALLVQPAADAEAHLQRGADFHRLVHQHAQGLSAEVLEATIADDTLARWWYTYLHHPPDLPDGVVTSELQGSAPLAGYRVSARFDRLVLGQDGSAVIVDWKTSPRRPSRDVLGRRLQSRVYPWLLVRVGAAMRPSRPIAAGEVEMIYWFADQQGSVERFAYSAEQLVADQEYLAGLVDEITARSESVWPLTLDERRCRFCNYRSLCERGVTAGLLRELDEDWELPELEINLEQVAEIAF